MSIVGMDNTYEECMDVIASMRFGDESDIFGTAIKELLHSQL